MLDPLWSVLVAAHEFVTRLSSKCAQARSNPRATSESVARIELQKCSYVIVDYCYAYLCIIKKLNKFDTKL